MHSIRRFLKAIAVAFLCAGPFVTAVFGTVFGTVRGVVHDPQHRPVPDSEVVPKAKASDYSRKTQTDVNGEFHFDAVAGEEFWRRIFCERPGAQCGQSPGVAGQQLYVWRDAFQQSARNLRATSLSLSLLTPRK